MTATTEEFLTKYLTELREDNAAVFVGAGLSKSAGFVDWRGLLEPLAGQLGLDIDRETDLVGLAQFHLNANQGQRGQLNQILIERFSDLPAPSDNHQLLARLPIRSYWTTNYDRLIEEALKSSGKRVDAKYTKEQLALTARGRDAVIYKMHGDVERPDQAILTKDDYERYADTHSPFITALSGDLVEKTFLFLGFSFTDPNLDYILSRIRTRFDKNQRQHFCIVKKRSQLKDESDQEFSYAKIRQDLVTQDLMRFNIKTVFVDDFRDITGLLRTLVDRYRMRTVFVSGSAAEYSPWDQTVTENFLRRLSGALIERDCRITSGFGLGIGSAVVTGAVEHIYSCNDRSIDTHLLLRPFPAGIQDSAEQAKVFGRYREEIVSQAGIALFFMGNKLDGNEIVPAPGVCSEYELAMQNGLHCIPVGASGHASKILWDKMSANISEHYPHCEADFYAAFNQIGQAVEDPFELMQPILYLINALRKG